MLLVWSSLMSGILNGGYTLIEIEDESVPLSVLPEVSNNYFGTVVVVMIAMMFLWMGTLYLVNCYKCRARIRQMKHDNDVYQGWRLTRLRESVEELELQEEEELVNDMEQIFIKNAKEAEPFLE